MNSIKNYVRDINPEHLGRALLMAALLALVMDPALAVEGNDGGSLKGVLDEINEITPGLKAVVAIVGFIVALISLVALRSFSAVLFFLGMAVFGSGGLAVAQAVMSATVSLI